MNSERIIYFHCKSDSSGRNGHNETKMSSKLKMIYFFCTQKQKFFKLRNPWFCTDDFERRQFLSRMQPFEKALAI